jgi:hypothetical protein
VRAQTTVALDLRTMEKRIAATSVEGEIPNGQVVVESRFSQKTRETGYPARAGCGDFFGAGGEERTADQDCRLRGRYS